MEQDFNFNYRKLAGTAKFSSFVENICILFFCLMYILAVNWALKPDYMNGELVVSSYEKSYSILRMIACLGIVIVVKEITYALVSNRDSVSYYIIRALYFLYEIPLILSYCLFDHENFFTFFVSEVAYWICICLALRFMSKLYRSAEKPKKIQMPKSFVRLCILAVVVAGIAYCIRAVGGVTVSFSLSGIYRIRAMYKENASDVVTFLKSAAGGYICPCMIAYYCAKKRWVFAGAACVLQCFCFLLARDKVYLFILPLAIAVGFFSSLIKEKFEKCLNAGYLCYGAGLFLAAVNIKRTLIMELLTRRMMVVPTYLNYVYYDFFTKNEPIWWRQDTFLVDKLFVPVYQQSVPLQISEVYFNKLEGNPNAGMFAEAFSRCGFFGIIIYPVLLAVLFLLIDHCYRDSGSAVKVLLGICVGVAVSNDVITSTAFVITMVLVLLASRFFRKNNDGEPVLDPAEMVET